MYFSGHVHILQAAWQRTSERGRPVPGRTCYQAQLPQGQRVLQAHKQRVLLLDRVCHFMLPAVHLQICEGWRPVVRDISAKAGEGADGVAIPQHAVGLGRCGWRVGRDVQAVDARAAQEVREAGLRQAA